MPEGRTVSRWPVFALVMLLTLIAGGEAFAQSSFELYLGYYFPDDQDVDDDLTYGLRIGHKATPSFGLEGALGRYETDIGFFDLEAIFADLSLVWFTNPGSPAEFLVYGGPGWVFWEADAGFVTVSNDSLTAHLGVGLKVALSDKFYLRPDVKARWFEEGDDDIDFEATLALGFRTK